MKEYTVIAAASVLATVFLDRLSSIRLLERRDYYFFLCVIFGFKLLVNGYLTGRGIVRYAPKFFLGLRLGSIPLEDFLFGFSMVTVTILAWEYFKKESG
ncbi:MAG: lycopene cyclase domain-containing protein [Candidatus Omnitrophica bacterium]|nr:lycopene cyclase domain-containing protein [Candidatus Omnitrophota bacterium]